MPTSWQKAYTASRDFKTPQDRAREREQKRQELKQLAEEYRTAVAYLCPECGYWWTKAVLWSAVDHRAHCPACGREIQVQQVFAPCPHCSKEHTISYVTARVVRPESLPFVAAKTLCIGCRLAGRRLRPVSAQHAKKVDIRVTSVERKEAQNGKKGRK